MNIANMLVLREMAALARACNAGWLRAIFVLSASTAAAYVAAPGIYLENAEVTEGWCELMLRCSALPAPGTAVSVYWSSVSGNHMASTVRISDHESMLSVRISSRNSSCSATCDAITDLGKATAVVDIISTCNLVDNTRTILLVSVLFLVANAVILIANAVMFICREYWYAYGVAERVVHATGHVFVTVSSPIHV